MYKLTCPYCAKQAILSDSSTIYGKDYGKVYLCINYPACDAFVGVHKGTDKPLGTLANSELRDLRKKAHKLFDSIWHEREMSRKDAYSWLASEMGLSKTKTHIAMFNESQCQQVIEMMKERIKEDVVHRGVPRVLEIWKKKTSI